MAVESSLLFIVLVTSYDQLAGVAFFRVLQLPGIPLSSAQVLHRADERHQQDVVAHDGRLPCLTGSPPSTSTADRELVAGFAGVGLAGRALVVFIRRTESSRSNVCLIRATSRLVPIRIECSIITEPPKHVGQQSF